MLSILAILAVTIEAPQEAGSPPPKTDVAAKDRPVVRPKPILPLSWVTSRDFPDDTIAPGKSYDVSVKMNVDASGRITTCTVASSSGSPQVDQKACELVMARGKYEPARSADGRAVPALAGMRYRVSN